MTELPFRRARAPEAKGQRRAQLLAAASDCLAEAPYAQVTMAAIARRAGVAKGATYRYFPSKEALFLELLLERLADWLAGLTPALAEAPGAGGDPGALAAAIASTLVSKPELIRLLSLLEPSLETSTDPEQIAHFKRRLLSALAPTAAWLEARVPALSAGDGLRFLRRAYALILGLSQLAAPPPAKRQALASDPALAAFELDFQSELQGALAAWLRGWLPGGR
ncbi:MAG TPA: TetR family transcriptional regulator [Thermoanaerobaculia bacterium]|nr:TetR family transcriptional regulator [Thermoanaerobaculia bacterium]